MTIGKNIKRLRLNKGVTQVQLAEQLHVSDKSISKWENEEALPDISFLPAIAAYFETTIDELMGYQLHVLTRKERFVKYMADAGILTAEKNPAGSFYLNSENFVTNAQIVKIGTYFADCIRDNHIKCNTIMGFAYHGISFSNAAACALYQKYGVIVNYCHDRKVPDRRGRTLCGYTLRDGDRIVVVDDCILSGKTFVERMDAVLQSAKVQIAAVVVIADRKLQGESAEGRGAAMIEEKYHTKVYSIITEDDIRGAIERHVI